MLQVLVTEGCVDWVRFVRFYPLDWLGQILQSAMQHFAQRIGGGFQMDFGFDVFSDSFPWKPEDQRSDDDVRKMMTERRPLIGGLD